MSGRIVRVSQWCHLEQYSFRRISGDQSCPGVVCVSIEYETALICCLSFDRLVLHPIWSGLSKHNKLRTHIAFGMSTCYFDFIRVLFGRSFSLASCATAHRSQQHRLVLLNDVSSSRGLGYLQQFARVFGSVTINGAWAVFCHIAFLRGHSEASESGVR